MQKENDHEKDVLYAVLSDRKKQDPNVSHTRHAAAMSPHLSCNMNISSAECIRP